MIRSICSQFKSPAQLSVLSSRFCTKPPRFNNREINEVRLVGVVQADVHNLNSNTKAFLLKSTESESRYSNINIHTRSSMDIQAGQRLCVSGKLKSESVQLTEGKTIQRTTIKANRLFAMENDSAASLCGDVNRVELLANVANDIFHSEKYSVFTVATNFTTLNSQGEEEKASNFHRIVVFDDAMREYIKNNVKKTDRVLVNGRLGQMTHTQPDGNKLYSGHIEAKTIYKVKKGVRNSNENQEEHAEN